MEEEAGGPAAAGSLAEALAPMLGDPDPVVRKSAVVALGRMGSPAATRMLCEALGDPSEGVRALACQALGRLADPACLPALLGRAHDPCAGVRAGALWGVANVAAHGGLSDEERSCLFAPVVAMAFDPDDGVRADAAAVLGTLRDERSSDALGVLLEDACERVRANACASLGLTDDPAGLLLLLDVLERDEAPLVLVSALDGAARRAERGSLPEGSQEAVRAVAAACRLARPGSDAGARTPGEAASVGPADVRSTAVWSLGMLAPAAPALAAQALEALRESLSSADPWCQRYAVESLARIGGADARAALSDGQGAVSDPEAEAQLSRALASLAGADAR